MIKTYVALSALIVALFILLLVISPYGEYQQTNTGTGYECYGWECVDPYPTEHRGDWGYQAVYCEEHMAIEDVKVNGNTVKVLIYYNCSL